MRKNGLSCLGGAVLFVLAVCSGMFAGPVFGETSLVRDGQPRADIVIAAQPTRAVKLAAAELQTYIAKISGAKLAITNTPGADVPAHIYVGRSVETDKLKISDEGLKGGAFRMFSGKDYLHTS